MRFTAIDFETANPNRASVCAIGLAVVKNGKIKKRMNQLIRPEPLRFDPLFVRIHGITKDAVADAPTFGEFWPSLWAGISGPLVAHNAAFDMSVLRHALDQCGTNYPDTDYFCTLVLSKLAWPQHPTHKLDHIAQSLGITFRHHDAEEDARVCAQIALAACKKVGVATLQELPDAVGLRIGRIFDGGYWPCGAR